MSIPQIFMRCDLIDDQRVLHVAAVTGANPAHVVGALQYFWSQAYTKGKHGRISGLTATAFEARVGIKGMVEALKQKSHPKIDWMREAADGSLIMPRADEKFAASARERDQEYENVRKAKWRAKKAWMQSEIKSLGAQQDTEEMSGTEMGQTGTVPTVKQSKGSSNTKQSTSEQSAAQCLGEHERPAPDAAEPAANPGWEIVAPRSAAALHAAAKPRGGDMFRALLLLGIGEPRRSEFANTPGITVEWLHDLQRRREAGKHKPGWAIRAIENQFNLTPPESDR